MCSFSSLNQICRVHLIAAKHRNEWEKLSAVEVGVTTASGWSTPNIRGTFWASMKTSRMRSLVALILICRILWRRKRCCLKFGGFHGTEDNSRMSASAYTHDSVYFSSYYWTELRCIWRCSCTPEYDVVEWPALKTAIGRKPQSKESSILSYWRSLTL